jgi:Ser/Thr protein kinase RdoA (MazF antagonist)
MGGSMAEEQSAGEMIAEVIRDHYDLGEISIPQRLLAAHQRRHRKLVISTGVGQFLVKTYKRKLEVLDLLRFQHRLSDHLSESGLPVARIQAAKSGKRIVEIDNWALELQQFIEGDSMKVSSKTLAVSARALGKFHNVCRDFPRPDRDARLWRFSEVPREIFGKLFELAREEGDSQALNLHCNSIALFLQDAAKTLHWEARSLFETGLIHGDWHIGNLIFQGNTLAGIVDLEFAGDGCYLEDLAYALSNLCVRTTTNTLRLEARTDILLDAYQQFRTLSPLEVRALYYAVGIKHVATVSYQTIQQDGTVAGFSPTQWMERLDLQCQWLAGRARAHRWGPD